MYPLCFIQIPGYNVYGNNLIYLIKPENLSFHKSLDVQIPYNYLSVIRIWPYLSQKLVPAIM